MSKATNTRGIIGGVLGIITSVAGFVWIATLMIFMSIKIKSDFNPKRVLKL